MRHLLPPYPQYRANLHAHSTLSDGALTPREVKELYRKNGYSAVCLCDHERLYDHSDLCDGSFLMLNGYEVSFAHAGRRNPEVPTCHLSLIAKSPSVTSQLAFADMAEAEGAVYETPLLHREYDRESISALLDRASAAGFFPILDHPFWSLQTPEEVGALPSLGGVEVYNTLCVREGSRDESAAMLDAQLRCGYRPIPVAADDNHNHPASHSSLPDTFGGWEMIAAPTLSYAAVIEALESGACYATTGPRFEALYTEDGYLVFRTTPVTRVTVYSDVRPVGACLHAEAGEALTFGRIPLPQDASYLRVEARDEWGHVAWTRAYDLSEC